MRATIKNPVTNSPWTSNMPNNFRGSQKASASRLVLEEPADLNVKLECRRHPRRLRKPTPKMQITQTYFEQLVPLYPFLSRTQVRAAITLANNNLHQSRLFLDLADKFMKIPPWNLVLNYQLPKPSGSTQENCARGSSRGRSNGSSFPTSDNSNLDSNSSVYDFTDSEYHSEPIQSWSSSKMQIAEKKIGVSIIRSSKGYKAFLL